MEINATHLPNYDKVLNPLLIMILAYSNPVKQIHLPTGKYIVIVCLCQQIK